MTFSKRTDGQPFSDTLRFSVAPARWPQQLMGPAYKQQVPETPGASAPNLVHFRSPICSSFLCQSPTAKALPAWLSQGAAGDGLPTACQQGTHLGRSEPVVGELA